ncbi:MAG: S-layer homology domain-containing protein [Desulfotomaculaceae bacterium]
MKRTILLGLIFFLAIAGLIGVQAGTGVSPATNEITEITVSDWFKVIPTRNTGNLVGYADHTAWVEGGKLRFDFAKGRDGKSFGFQPGSYYGFDNLFKLINIRDQAINVSIDVQDMGAYRDYISIGTHDILLWPNPNNHRPIAAGDSMWVSVYFDIPPDVALAAPVNGKLVITASGEDSGDDGDGSGGKTPDPVKPSSGVEMAVNDQTQDQFVTATTTIVGDRTVTTVTVDPKLEIEANNSVVTILTNTKSDVVVCELNGQMVKNMEQKQAVLVIKTEFATYTLPAQQINIDAVSEQIGQQVELKDIKVKIEIAKSSAETVKIIENSAIKGEYTVVAPPVDFKVTCTYGDKTVEVSRFNSYVERTIAIPDGVDPQKITTGVVLNSDGTVSHVPTKIIVIDGKYYAQINCLTNSTYFVIWHPKTFQDVESHWAGNCVNEMGSRLVIGGVDENNFAPNRDITRAEFAAIVGRALGLKASGTASKFSDVKANDWFYGAVGAASAYGIVGGYEDGTFKPDQAISREEAMAMIARAMKLAGMDTNMADSVADAQLARFKDQDSVNGWAKKSAATCVKYGIAVGNNGLLAPDDNITRAETAAMVMRMLQQADLI